MKVLLTLLKATIAIYLALIALLYAYFFTQKEIYANKFPFIQEYSYYKITDSEYEPDYKKNDYVFVQKTFDVKEEDYVIYIESGIVKFKKIININGPVLTLKNPNGKEQTTLDSKEVIAKAVYVNDFVSFLLNWLTEPVIIIIIFVIAVLLPEVEYRKYD